MGLEAATKISELVATNPTGTDPKSQGDDHIRLIKSVLQADALSKSGGVMTGGLSVKPAATGTDDGNVVSGTYTPTLTADNNISTLTPALFMYSRVGNVVTVSGRPGVAPAAVSVETRFTISLPIASNLADANDAVGVMNVRATASAVQWPGTVEGLSTDVALTRYFPSATGNHQAWVTFQYRIK